MRYRGRGIIVSKYKGNALFYKLKENLALEDILSVFLCKPENPKEVIEHIKQERHWLADWDFKTTALFDRFQDGDEIEVEFEIKSTSYGTDAKHNGISIGPHRNLNVTEIKGVSK